jgi:hypothetical protein
MWKTSNLFFCIAWLLIIPFLASCNSPSNNDGAATAIETYLQALVERDFNKMANSSCAAWEAQAKVEFDSFSAVKLELNDLVCKDSGQDDDYILVSCSGSIIANYGAEELEINIADRSYRAVQEGGEWRMCGYK